MNPVPCSDVSWYRIPGGAALAGWFSGEPSFGDAELVTFKLAQPGRCCLSLKIATQAGTVASPDRSSEIVVVLHIHGIRELSICGFADQNVLDALTLRIVDGEFVADVDRSGWRPNKLYELNLVPVIGLAGRIVAERVEVDVVPPPSASHG